MKINIKAHRKLEDACSAIEFKNADGSHAHLLHGISGMIAKGQNYKAFFALIWAVERGEFSGRQLESIHRLVALSVSKFNDYLDKQCEATSSVKATEDANTKGKE